MTPSTKPLETLPMKFLLAAAATDTGTATNKTSALISAEHGLIARFEEATGLPREVAIWSVNILGALVILIGGFIVAGIARAAWSGSSSPNATSIPPSAASSATWPMPRS